MRLEYLQKKPYLKKIQNLIVSLIITWVIYIFTQEPSSTSLIKEAHLKIHLPSHLYILHQNPQTVSVKVSARGRDKKLEQLHISGELYLTDIQKPGLFHLPIQKSWFKIPHTYSLTLLDYQLNLEVDYKMEKKVPIEAIFEVDAAQSEKIVLTPNSIIVKGPQSILQNLKQIQTKPIPESLLEGESAFQIGLDIENLNMETSQSWVSVYYKKDK